MTLRLPPPSDPPEHRQHQPVGTKTDPCGKCPHDWHGLVCRYNSCLCQTSIEAGVLDE